MRGFGLCLGGRRWVYFSEILRNPPLSIGAVREDTNVLSDCGRAIEPGINYRNDSIAQSYCPSKRLQVMDAELEGCFLEVRMRGDFHRELSNRKFNNGNRAGGAQSGNCGRHSKFTPGAARAAASICHRAPLVWAKRGARTSRMARSVQAANYIPSPCPANRAECTTSASRFKSGSIGVLMR